jgi:hypothetical protein
MSKLKRLGELFAGKYLDREVIIFLCALVSALQAKSA